MGQYGWLKKLFVVTFYASLWVLGARLLLTPRPVVMTGAAGRGLKGALDDAKQPDDRNGDHENREQVASLAFKIALLLLVTHNASLNR